MTYNYNPKRKRDPRRYLAALKFPDWLPKRQDGLCRCGCGKPVNRGKVWHTAACCNAKVEEFQILKGSISVIRTAVFRRDLGICAGCGLDTNEAAATCDMWAAKATAPDRQAAAAAREKFMLLGYPTPQGHRVYGMDKKPLTVHGWNWWQADHIKPLVEGGSHGLENFRTLCTVCHKAETKALARRRSKAGRGDQNPILPFATEEALAYGANAVSQ